VLPAAPFARFDDVRPGRERAWSFAEPLGVLRADELDEVVPVLEAVDEAARRGQWATGWLAYEAGAALDPALAHRRPDVPYAWFALWGRRVRVPSLIDGAAEPPQRASGTDLAVTTTPARHRCAVEAIVDAIAAGDVYQVNLTAGVDGPAADPLGLARTMAAAQRGGHHALVVSDGHAVVSASPELFLARRGPWLLSRPMKGTAARGRWAEHDGAAAAALLASEKDRAELVMIVDLVRNDLGRVAVPGTVRADREPRLEAYPTVWQLTARVAARARPGTGLVDVLRATFPPGSVTGAPKVAACRIIAALEGAPRGVYCGAVGWVGPGERARFNVAIRTAVVDLAAGRLRYGAGGGITADSDAGREWAELRQKALVLASGPADGVFETLRVTPRRGAVRASRHLGRLAAAARRWCLPFDGIAARACLDEAVAATSEPSRLRLELHPDGRLRAVAAPLPPRREPVRLVVDDEPVDQDDPRASWKLLDRDRFARRLARHPGVDDVVLVNRRGELVETTTANLLVRVGGRWCTPPLDSGCLPGVGRAVLLDAGRVHERVLTPADLEAASAVAVVSSLRGIRRAALVAAGTARPVPA